MGTLIVQNGIEGGSVSMTTGQCHNYSATTTVLQLNAMRARVRATGGVEARCRNSSPTCKVVTALGAQLDCQVGMAVRGLSTLLWVARRACMHERP
eukprot:1160071-Pelagomonas_calceolata.AAC.12